MLRSELLEGAIRKPSTPCMELRYIEGSYTLFCSAYNASDFQSNDLTASMCAKLVNT